MSRPSPTPSHPSEAPASGELIPTEGRALPLTHAHVTAVAADGLARLVLKQRFENHHDVPLEITYSLPLPSEAAVSGFSFTMGDRVIVGEVDRKRRARERYEEALATGHTAALVEQERDTLFTQSLGNVPPRTHIEAEIVIDTKLRYLGDGSFELRVPTTVAPRYLGEAGRVTDVERVAQDVAASHMPLRLTMDVSITGVAKSAIESTTHAVTCSETIGASVVRFRDEGGAALDRDVVLRWRAAKDHAAAAVRVTRPRGSSAAYAMFTITPPLVAMKATPRDLVLLLDTSGSMHGLPIEQAKRVSLALVSTLGDADTLEMISFSSSPSRWKRGATKMDARGRNAAASWLSGLRASGGTEMRDAILEALRPLREGAQRQIVLVTDGLIGFETEIVRAILEELPAGSRVHTVGVGSSVNRSLTSGAAHAGRGIEVIADEHEDPERIAARLVARTSAPLVTDLVVRGSPVRTLATEKMPDLFAGSPFMLSAEVDPAGGKIVLEGKTAAGPWRSEIELPACHEGDGLAAIEQLYARDRAADLEMRAAAGENVDEALESIGLAHRIATRLTSWLAISQTKTVDETSAFRRERMPHELPYGTSAEAFGLREAFDGAPSFDDVRTMVLGGAAAPSMPGPGAPPPARARASFAGPPPPPQSFERGGGGPPTGAPPPPRAPSPKQSEESSEKAKGGMLSRLFKRAAPSPKPEAPREEAASSGGDQGESFDREEASTDHDDLAAPTALFGKVTVRKDGVLVITVPVPPGFIWSAAAAGWLVLQSGVRLVVRVKASPPAGPLPYGAEMRLTFEVTGDLGTEPIVEVELADGTRIAIR